MPKSRGWELNQRQVETSPVIPGLFAFDSDLTENGESEIERYQRLDSCNPTDPLLRAICVVGRGYWYYDNRDNRWVFLHPSQEHDEVVGFLSGVMNTIPDALASRGRPRLGNYLMTPRPSDDTQQKPL
jgi:hypothetical protein